MYNDWFTIGRFTIHGYGAMIAVGILAAFFVGERLAKKHGLSLDITDSMIFTALISGFAGSKILYALTNLELLLKDPMAVLGADGWVVYGGILGGLFGMWVYSRIKKISFMDYLNLLAPEVALGQAFGRIGCFFAGCCYGRVTASHFGVVFPAHSMAPAGVSLIPTQLISSFGDFVLFAILYKIFESSHRDQTAAWYLILYSIGRFLVEFLRGDEIRGHIGALSTSQFIALFMFAGGVIMYLRSRKTGNI